MSGVQAVSDAIEAVATALQMWWLTGIEDEALKEWWGTSDAHDTAVAAATVAIEALRAAEGRNGHGGDEK